MSQVKVATAPFLKIILPATLGLIFSRLVDIPWVIVAVCCVACFVLALILRNRQEFTAQLYVWFTIFLFFFAVSEYHTPKSELPAGERVVVAVQISEPLFERGRWQLTAADVGYYRVAGQMSSQVAESATERDDVESGKWHKVNERVMLAIDTSYREIGVGTQLAFRGWFNPIDTIGSAYGNLMRMRGLHGRLYLTSGNLLWKSAHVSHTPSYYASKLQVTAIKRLEKLNIPNDDKAVVTAMTAGDKRAIGGDLRASYSTTGAAHLLAVSGLHVGIVFVLINILLYLVPFFDRGHIVKNVAAIVAIWLYAATAGLAPSVIRAALMFSFAQLAMATNSYRSALNVMLGSAIIMLAINPNYATDPSFLLSYAAVLTILLFFTPLYRIVALKIDKRKPSRWRKFANALISVILVGFVATMGTAPLVAYWFGNFPFIGMLINPIVIFTAHIIVMVGVLWIVIPIGFLNPVFSWILSVASSIQNGVVDWSASLSWASIGVSPSLWLVCVIYILYLILAVWLYNRPQEKALFYTK